MKTSQDANQASRPVGSKASKIQIETPAIHVPSAPTILAPETQPTQQQVRSTQQNTIRLGVENAHAGHRQAQIEKVNKPTNDNSKPHPSVPNEPIPGHRHVMNGDLPNRRSNAGPPISGGGQQHNSGWRNNSCEDLVGVGYSMPTPPAASPPSSEDGDQQNHLSRQASGEEQAQQRRRQLWCAKN